VRVPSLCIAMRPPYQQPRARRRPRRVLAPHRRGYRRRANIRAHPRRSHTASILRSANDHCNRPANSSALRRKFQPSPARNTSPSTFHLTISMPKPSTWSRLLRARWDKGTADYNQLPDESREYDRFLDALLAPSLPNRKTGKSRLFRGLPAH